MCSGRIDLSFILRAFANGMDGVFIGGCRLNECNYVTHGNYHALNVVLLCKKIMEHIGLKPDRLRIGFMSSDGMDEDEIKSKIREVTKLIPYIKIVKREKLESRLENEEAYDGLFTSDEVGRLFREVISYHVDPDKCQACMMCLKKCPVEAIAGGKNRIHVIDQEKCIKCGTCFETCPHRFGAVQKISGEPVPPPISEAERTIVRKRREKGAS
jgi:F420-non-reducing hydrogenase iron-sulfur subunit